MGSPYETFKTNRVHVVTTTRGAAMILRKILLSTGEVVYDENWAGNVSNVVESIFADNSVFNDFWYSDEAWPARDTVLNGIPLNLVHVVSEFLEAMMLAQRAKTSIPFVCTARYQWKGWEKFQCVVIFNL